MLLGIGLGLIGALLYRIRGGLLDKYIWDSTQIARLIWAIPTAVLVYYGTTPYISTSEIPYARVVLLVLSFMASLIFFGHGAHMIMSFDLWKNQWVKGNLPDDTENLTSWWLPKVFDGTPTAYWPEQEFLWYHIAGMSFIGIVRNAVASLPFIFLEPSCAIVYTISGLAHGFLYYFGWLIPDLRPFSNFGSQNGELFVGFISWFTLGYLLYG